MKHVISILDKVAAEVQALGLTHLALEIDQVSDSLEGSNLKNLKMPPQPDDVSCGPTCLSAVYNFFGMPIPIEQVRKGVTMVPGGGTSAAYLGLDAMARGFATQIHVYDLNLFDPTWSGLDAKDITAKIQERMANMNLNEYAKVMYDGYIKFLDKGGKIVMEDITPDTLKRVFDGGAPILACVSDTWLYRSMRDYTTKENKAVDDDIKGDPEAHFIVLHGMEGNDILVADPYAKNPLGPDSYYRISYNKFLHALLLGVLTLDANLLIITPATP